MHKPLAIDLCSGLGGWAEGLEAAGYDVIRVDIEDMFAATGTPKPDRCLLMVQDILTFHGSQARNVDLIVASPPCQEYSYMAMPWTLAKAKAAKIRADETGVELERLNRLFNACFRVQREACEAAGRHVPLVVENVRGAIPWVGRSRWAYGSYHIWGDVPALMPPLFDGRKNPGFRFDGSGRSFQSESVARHVSPDEGFKSKGMNWSDRSLRGQDFTRIAGMQAQELGGRKNTGGSWFKIGSPGQTAVNNNPDGRQWTRDPVASCGSKSPKRKAASAKIAKIPFTLSNWIGRCYLPPEHRSAA